MGDEIPRVRACGSENAADWFVNHQDHVDTEMQRFGAISLDGFALDEVAAFEELALVSCAELYRDNPEHVSASASLLVDRTSIHSAEFRKMQYDEIFHACSRTQPSTITRRRSNETPAL